MPITDAGADGLRESAYRKLEFNSLNDVPCARFPNERSVMVIKEMTAKQCHEFLGRMEFGRLGCVHDTQPYLVPIYFAYEPDRLYGFSTLGRKIDWMRLNPRVCVEVDEVINTKSW